MSMTGGISFYEKNKALKADGASCVASSNTDNDDLILGTNKYFRWESSGSDDSTPETLTITLAAQTEISRIFLIAHNFKDFTIQYKNSNICLQSQTLDNASWTKTRCTVVADDANDPNAAATADKLVLDGTAGATHFIRQSIAFTAGKTYTFSVYLKSDELTFAAIQLPLDAFGTAQRASINLTTGATSSDSGAPVIAAVAAWDGGWRLSIRATATITATGSAQIYLAAALDNISFDGDSASGLHVWGAQVEVAYVASAYSVTTTAAAGITCEFLGVTGLDDYSAALIDESTFALDTAYYEFSPINLTEIVITANTTQVADAEKYLTQFVATNELGTLDGFPNMNGITLDRNDRKEKAISGRVHIEKGYESAGFDLALRTYGEQDDIDLLDSLHEMEEPFLVWLCGGDPDQFRLEQRGFRLQDLYQMKIDQQMKNAYDRNIYVLGVNQNYSFIEVV